MQGRQYYLLALGLLIYINNLLVFLTGFEFIDAHQQFDYTARCGKKSIPGAIRHMFDFSGKLCHCYDTLKLLGSTFNQKGEHIDGS